MRAFASGLHRDAAAPETSLVLTSYMLKPWNSRFGFMAKDVTAALGFCFQPSAAEQRCELRGFTASLAAWRMKVGRKCLETGLRKLYESEAP